ncbi:MAG: hypothetical protein V3V78_01190 [Candidatus Woesearchaeota archaeon]
MYSTIDTIMADEKKKEYHKAIKDYNKHSDIAENLVTGMDLSHMRIYSSTAEEVLGVEGKPNQKDLDKLKKTENQIKFADTYLDKCIDDFLEKKVGKDEAAKAALKKKLKLDDRFEQALATRAHYGTTRDELRDILSKEKENFTPDKFMDSYKTGFMKTFKADIRGAAGYHLTEEHVDPILKYAVKPDTIKRLKKYGVSLDMAKTLLNNYDGEKRGDVGVLELHTKMVAATKGKARLLTPTLEKEIEDELEAKKKKANKELEEASA